MKSKIVCHIDRKVSTFFRTDQIFGSFFLKKIKVCRFFRGNDLIISVLCFYGSVVGLVGYSEGTLKYRGKYRNSLLITY